jgi:hypothetical protein
MYCEMRRARVSCSSIGAGQLGASRRRTDVLPQLLEVLGLEDGNANNALLVVDELL